MRNIAVLHCYGDLHNSVCIILIQMVTINSAFKGFNAVMSESKIYGSLFF